MVQNILLRQSILSHRRRELDRGVKILLVPPTFHYKDAYPSLLSFSDFPSGFGYLAAVLKQAGHEVIGLNPNNIPGYPSAKLMLQDVLSRKVKECRPDLIGLGGLCTDYAFLRDAIAIIRGADKGIPIVLGGQIVTNDAEFIIKDLKPDWGIEGEGEEAVVQLANVLQMPQPVATIQGIQNLWYYNNGNPMPIRTGTNYKPIDDLPFPDYEPFGVQDMLDNHSMDTRLLYRYSRPYPRPFNIVASRSCPFTCTFCVHGRRDAPYRARSIENIMQEIRVNYEKYKFNILIILDELFAVNGKRMRDFSDGVLAGKEKHGWNFDWMFQTHANAHFDLETLKLAKMTGCFFFSYGLESASPVVLKSMNKKLEVQQVIEAMELARQTGVGFGANLIFGDPAETTETWAESLAFWLKYGQANFTFLSSLMPYPGSKVFEDCQAKGMFQDKRKYYEQIDEGTINMTAIPDRNFGELLNLTISLEKAWLFVKPAVRVHTEREGATMHKVWATCPHCGQESMYRENLPDLSKPVMLGTGCTKCNQRIKVNIGG